MVGLGFTIKATLVDGHEHKVDSTMGDLVRLQRNFPGFKLSELGEEAVDQIVFLAWSGLHRTHVYEGDYETFVDEIAMVEVVGDADRPPLPPPAE